MRHIIFGKTKYNLVSKYKKRLYDTPYLIVDINRVLINDVDHILIFANRSEPIKRRYMNVFYYWVPNKSASIYKA